MHLISPASKWQHRTSAIYKGILLVTQSMVFIGVWLHGYPLPSMDPNPKFQTLRREANTQHRPSRTVSHSLGDWWKQAPSPLPPIQAPRWQPMAHLLRTAVSGCYVITSLRTCPSLFQMHHCFGTAPHCRPTQKQTESLWFQMATSSALVTDPGMGGHVGDREMSVFEQKDI